MPDLFTTPPENSLLYTGHYDPVLVALSLVIAVFASYAALLVSHYVSSQHEGRSRNLWLAGGSLSLGIGIWAMHFVGMLAFSLPCSTSYDASLTFISTIPGILASALALKIISRPRLTHRKLTLGGLLIGTGIGAMHYAGMAAMRLDGFIRYDLGLFLLSLLVAVALASLALLVKFHLQSRWNRWQLPASALVMGLAMSGMHYTAMAAAYFIRDSSQLAPTGIAPPLLAAIVLAASSLIVVLTIVATYVGRPQQTVKLRFFKLIGLLIAAWIAVSWLSANYYFKREASEAYLRESQLAEKRASQISDNISESISNLKGIAQMVANESLTTLILNRPSAATTVPSALSELNRELAVTSVSLGADEIFIMNATGDCVAASNAGKKNSFVGSNYADRAYFKEAMSNQPGHQYAVGRTSNIPGLYYSHPVIVAGRIVGVAAAKRNIDHYSHWIDQANAFLSDSNGVIVLAYDKSLEFKYLPDAGYLNIPPAQRLRLYRDARITPLDITPWQTGRFRAAALIGSPPSPMVLARQEMTEDGITVHVVRPLQAVTRLDEQQVWLFLMLSATGSMLIVGASGFALYLRESKQTASDLRIAASAFEAQEGMLITDADTTILRVNKAFSNVTGFLAEEVIGKTPRMLKSGRHDATYYRAMWDGIRHTGSWEGEIWNRRKNGEIYPAYMTITAVRDGNGVIVNYVGTFNDISRNKMAEAAINKLAFYDPLTHLPNRRLLMDRLHQAMSSSSRSAQQCALLFIDLDNFKAINDTLGHNTGDQLLQQVAQRLHLSVREGDTVARMGGDEFVIMLENLGTSPNEAAATVEAIGEKLLAVLNHPYQLGDQPHSNTPSIGVTLFSGHDLEAEELMKQADIAMYQSKKAGRNTLRFFDPQMQDSINARASLEAELRRAIAERQFRLHYQIQVDGARRAVGAEALLRWQHPVRGMVSPAQFIPLLEETGLILPVGLWVLETACAQISAWQHSPLTAHLTLAVNVSARQFSQTDFVRQVQHALADHAADPRRLKLELTESLLLENVNDTIAKMNALNDAGIQFSLDDFGTGYSSLQYLKRLPLDQLKIDQSFVRDIASDGNDRAIVRTIIAMAESLNLKIIAEGVETPSQLDMLRQHGCTHFQGYLFGRPMPLEQFDALLKELAA